MNFLEKNGLEALFLVIITLICVDLCLREQIPAKKEDKPTNTPKVYKGCISESFAKDTTYRIRLSNWNNIDIYSPILNK